MMKFKNNFENVITFLEKNNRILFKIALNVNLRLSPEVSVKNIENHHLIVL